MHDSQANADTQRQQSLPRRADERFLKSPQ
jgi:hypothetical protein